MAFSLVNVSSLSSFMFSVYQSNIFSVLQQLLDILTHAVWGHKSLHCMRSYTMWCWRSYEGIHHCCWNYIRTFGGTGSYCISTPLFNLQGWCNQAKNLFSLAGRGFTHEDFSRPQYLWNSSFQKHHAMYPYIFHCACTKRQWELFMGSKKRGR